MKPFAIMVVEGDTIEKLADDFLTTPDEIRSLNKMAPGEQPAPGQTLMMPPAKY